jgi:hypothetical protein
MQKNTVDNEYEANNLHKKGINNEENILNNSSSTWVKHYLG